MSLTGTLYKVVVVKAIRQEVPGVKTFTLCYDDSSAIPYTSGQFITLVFTHHGREERRSYSVSSASVRKEPLAITIKRLDNGAYSRMLHDKVVVGDKLFTAGVSGRFTLPQQGDGTGQYFFFAAGIGITPIYSLIKELLAASASTQVVLVYSNRMQEEVVFFEELNTLATQYSGRFEVEFLYSTSFNLGRARLSKALVRTLLKEYGRVETANMQFFICGPYSYMRMVTYALEEGGAQQQQIRKENFNTDDRAVIVQVPPDTDAHEVTIIHKAVAQTITCQYPDTILQAAKKNGIALPYSCETGRCGSCAAICTSGKVWISYNEVLMDVELRHGSILTCTGYPVGGDIIIEV